MHLLVDENLPDEQWGDTSGCNCKFHNENGTSTITVSGTETHAILSTDKIKKVITR